MSSRSDVLERIRSRLRRIERDTPAARDTVQSYLRERPIGPRPAISENLVERFCRNSEALSSTVERVATCADAPAAVARYLRSAGLPMSAVCWPQLEALPWQDAGICIEARPARDEDLVGVTGTFCAIAETGTMVLCSGAFCPSTVSLLPETHIALVSAARVVRGMEEAWHLVRQELGRLPRAVNFVSGPSRTGDIEQTIVLGAHGPYRVHIVLVEDQCPAPSTHTPAPLSGSSAMNGGGV